MVSLAVARLRPEYPGLRRVKAVSWGLLGLRLLLLTINKNAGSSSMDYASLNPRWLGVK